MHIVYLAHYAGSPEHGMVHAYYHLAQEWLKMGHQVTIIAASYAHPRSKQPLIRGAITEEYIDDIRYLWVRVPSYSPRNYSGRAMNILRFVMQTWFSKLPIENADLVICSSHHPFAIFPAKKLAKRHKARLIFEVRDLWPLSLIELGQISPWHPFIWFMQRAENYAYKHAGHVVSVLSAADKYMSAHGLEPNRYSYIPNGFSVDTWVSEALPEKTIKSIESKRLEHDMLIGYAGGLNTGNALYYLIESLARLKTQHSVCLLLLGDGPNKRALSSLVLKLGLEDRVCFLGSVQKSAVADFLARVDVVFVGFQKKNFYKYGVSPTKLNDYMYAAKPVIYAIDAPHDPVEESGAGISCEAEDVEAIAKAVDKMSNLPAPERQEMGKLGYEWLLKNRNYSKLARRFLEEVIP